MKLLPLIAVLLLGGCAYRPFCAQRPTYVYPDLEFLMDCEYRAAGNRELSCDESRFVQAGCWELYKSKFRIP